MARWSEFAAGAPAMAERGRGMIYKFGIGLGYIATVRKDGGPRMHPMCPIIAGDGLYAFILNESPKGRDLLRDGRYALHSFPMEDVDDEFYVTGTAVAVHDAEVEAQVDAAYTATGGHHDPEKETLFELHIEHALTAVYEARGTWPPVYEKWHARGQSLAARV